MTKQTIKVAVGDPSQITLIFPDGNPEHKVTVSLPIGTRWVELLLPTPRSRRAIDPFTLVSLPSVEVVLENLGGWPLDVAATRPSDTRLEADVGALPGELRRFMRHGGSLRELACKLIHPAVREGNLDPDLEGNWVNRLARELLERAYPWREDQRRTVAERRAQEWRELEPGDIA